MRKAGTMRMRDDAQRHTLRGLLAEVTPSTRPASGSRHEAAEDDARPHVVVADIVVPSLDEIAATAPLLARRPGTRVVPVTVHGDPELAERGYAACALAGVWKHSAGDELVPAVHAAMRGERFVSPSARGHLDEPMFKGADRRGMTFERRRPRLPRGLRRSGTTTIRPEGAGMRDGKES